MMNIKRMPSCIAVVVAALLLAVSCGNMLEAPKAEGVEGGMGRLAVSMGDGRAVFPEELEFGTDKELTFTLSGSLSGGEGKEIRSWKAEGDKTAYQVMVADTGLTVEAGQWSFTLQAKRGGTVVATASKDLEVKGGTTNRLSFGTMAYSNEGTGIVTVTISWNEVERVTSVVAGLYNASDDTMVENTQQTLTPAESKVTYTKFGVPAGIYRLKAQMKQGETVIGSYSELVRVAGGLSSVAERELGSLNTLYTVTLDFGGQGELRTSFPETYNRSQTVTLPTADQVASTTGAEFLHWYEEGDTEKKEVTEIAGLDGDKTYCAYWQVAPVAFTPAGGTTLYYGDIVTLATATAGATIHYTVNDGEEKTGASPVTVSVTGDTTIIAKATKDGFKDSAETKATYTLKRYTVTFNANGGTGTMDSQTFISGVEQELSANAFERENYTFSGWSEDKAADAAIYTDKAKFTATKDTSLYAVWEANVTIAIDGTTATITIPDDDKDTRVQNAMNEFTAEGLTTIIVEGPLNETRQGYIATALAGKTVTLYLTHLAEDELSEALASADDGITVNCGYYMADASTYVAYNADGLQAWSTYAQANPTTNLSLGKDITLPLAEGETSNWTSVGTRDTPYTGTVNGNGYSITGMTINQTTNRAGFIGALGENGAVKNLKLKAVSVTTTTGGYIGGLVGYGHSFSVIENCAVEGGTISSNEGGSVGGIVGYAEGKNSAPALIVACHNTAAVSGKANVGGIVGTAWEYSRVIACYNSGTITHTDGKSCGGIVGNLSSSLTDSCCNYNTGTTTGKTAIAGNTPSDRYHNYWSSEHDYANISNNGEYNNYGTTKITSASEWQTAMTTMNTWLAENGYAYRYVINTDAVTKEAQPLVIVEASATE